MITAQPATCQAKEASDVLRRFPGWQRELAEAVTDPLELLSLVNLELQHLGTGDTQDSLRAACRLFPLRVPRGFVARMQSGNPNDPLLRQVLPLGVETAFIPGFDSDPLHESQARKAPGLLHKYEGRALMITTGACAVHCRYCFRREYDYAADQDSEGESRWSAPLEAIRADKSIEEIILSGGDPLSLSNARLEKLLHTLAALPQVKRLRIHTRTPIVLPSRVDAGLLQIFAALDKDLIVVVHSNHTQEIDTPTADALGELRGATRLLLNQSVLLANINDNADALTELSLRLFECGVQPYYLHQLDKVAGAAHFEVTDVSAAALIAAVNSRLPGYLVPKLVREVAGAAGKTPIFIGTGPTGT
jgi:L-lysine 2,3-aminomutase